MKNLHKLCCLILCVIFFNPLAIHAEPLKPVRVQLKWYHQFQFAGFYAAIKKGYFKDAGLDVTLLEGTPKAFSIPAVLSGKADFGVTGPELLDSYISGEPVVLMSVIFQHSPYVLLTMTKNKISAPS